jgi:hypothetical protein
MQEEARMAVSRTSIGPALAATFLVATLPWPTRAITTDPTSLQTDALVDTPGQIEHCDDEVADRDFLAAFDCGDELFGTAFNAVDGVGAHVGDGGRFTRTPRSDQRGPGAWASHIPTRATGPNSGSCTTCHNQPVEDGAGENFANNVRDPMRTNDPGRFIQRNPPHIFGIGAVQRLAEQFNADLLADVAQATRDAARQGTTASRELEHQGIAFGSVTATPRGAISIDAEGIDSDLILKPFDWKGVLPTVRSFIRDAAHQELGMNPVETAGDDVDGDFDGVVNEFLIEDVTALTIYQAGQPRPTTELELNALRIRLSVLGSAGAGVAGELGLPRLGIAESISILRGSRSFEEIGCTVCHRPALVLADPVFSEPSQNPSYREGTFPAGQNPIARGVDPARPIQFDLTRDLPDNVIRVGTFVIDRLGSFERIRGQAIVELFGDLKRHDMGPGLAENIDAAGTGASVFLTENLWGVGSTSPYLHDGRATSLSEAIREHGGEAQASRDRFLLLTAREQRDLVRFLKNLVLFKAPEEES